MLSKMKLTYVFLAILSFHFANGFLRPSDIRSRYVPHDAKILGPNVHSIACFMPRNGLAHIYKLAENHLRLIARVNHRGHTVYLRPGHQIQHERRTRFSEASFSLIVTPQDTPETEAFFYCEGKFNRLYRIFKFLGSEDSTTAGPIYNSTITEYPNELEVIPEPLVEWKLPNSTVSTTERPQDNRTITVHCMMGMNTTLEWYLMDGIHGMVAIALVRRHDVTKYVPSYDVRYKENWRGAMSSVVMNASEIPKDGLQLTCHNTTGGHKSFFMTRNKVEMTDVYQFKEHFEPQVDCMDCKSDRYEAYRQEKLKKKAEMIIRIFVSLLVGCTVICAIAFLLIIAHRHCEVQKQIKQMPKEAKCPVKCADDRPALDVI